MDAAEYKHLVLGLIFVKYISRAELRQRLTDPNDEYFYGDAAPQDNDAELEDRDYYRWISGLGKSGARGVCAGLPVNTESPLASWRIKLKNALIA